MIRKIIIEGFKCFHKRQSIPLSQINILYGKNGRGKSTIAQSFLLLAQTMKECNDVAELRLMGDLIELGTFDEVINVNAKSGKFYWAFQDDDNLVEFGFEKFPHKTQMAKLCKLLVNNENRFDVKTTSDKGTVSENKSVSTTSDIMMLQNFKLLQYVSAGRLGPNNYYARKDSLEDNWLGVKGEYVINVLTNQGPSFQEKVCEVLSEILTGATLEARPKDSDSVELFLDSVNNGNKFRPINVGFGYSYVLPVIVAALLAKKGSILIVENPEAHLHPGAQSRLTKFLIENSMINNIQLIIETHSDHVVNGLRIAMKQELSGLAPNNAEIIFFSHDDVDINSSIKIIECDRYGELSEYPDDFLDEWTKQLVTLV